MEGKKKKAKSVSDGLKHCVFVSSMRFRFGFRIANYTLQSGDSGEFTRVARHKDQAVECRNRSNLQIEWTNWRSLLSKLTPQFSKHTRRVAGERNTFERREERFQYGMIAASLRDGNIRNRATESSLRI